MLETALLMVTAHLLGDFVFQPDWLLAAKRKTWGMAVHGLVLGALTALCLTPTTRAAWYAAAIIVATHLAMDLIKTHRLGDRLWSFALDQLFHLAVIVALALAWPELASQSLLGRLPGDVQARLYAGLAIVCGMVLGVPAGGVLVKKLVDLLAPPAATSSSSSSSSSGVVAGMRNAGRYIGWLERGLSIIFMLIRQPEAIGFIVAAKSILRFRDIQDPADRHQAEYIIIGTFLSFGWAIVVALATRAAIDHWLG